MSTMATMNIKDPEVHRMAQELAAMRHTSATGAVRGALQEALERQRRTLREGVGGRLRDIADRGRALDETVLDVERLYDEHGLPR